jgi:hypothetical protein
VASLESKERNTPWLLLTFVFLSRVLIALLIWKVSGSSALLRRLTLAVRITWLLLGGYFVLISGMPGAVARYRGPLMPMVCICAGAAIAYLWAKRGKATSVGAGQA